MKKRIGSFILVLCLLMCSLGTMVQADTSKTLTVFHINDIHGYAVETGSAIGYAKLAGYVEDYRSTDPNTLFLDAGDVFRGNAYAAFDQCESLIKILNTVGLDAMTGGNADFVEGPDKFGTFAGALEDYDVLGANVVVTETGERVENVDDYCEFTTNNGIKVGVIGVTTPDSVKGNEDKYTYLNAVETAKDLADEHSDSVDVLIGLVHLGVNDNASYEVTSDDLAEEVPEFDVIIDGHSHDIVNRVVNGVRIVQTGANSENLGKLTITLDENNEVTGTSETLISAADLVNQAPKADTQAATIQLLADYEDAMNVVIGSTSVYLDAAREKIRTSETNMGNLFADAMLDYTGADIALASSYGIGGDVGPGDLTKGDVLSMARAESLIVTVEMTGAELLAALNSSVSLYPQQSAQFLQVSGIRFKFDPELASEKVFAVTVNGVALDLSAAYTVACFEHMSTADTVIKEWVNSDVMVEKYISENSPVSPQVEGRITVVGSSARDTFTDVDVYQWYYNFVSYAYDNGLMIGTSDDTFAPMTDITRGEFIAALRNMYEQMGYDVSSSNHNNFTDVDYSEWYGPFINWAYENGVAAGYGDGTFGPEALITRQEIAAVLVNFADFIGIELDTTGSYTGYGDSSAISDWAKSFVEKITLAGIMEGSYGNFDPLRNTTRAESATVISKFYERYDLAGLADSAE